MTEEKIYTEREVSEKIQKVFKDYIQLFQADKMDYPEFILVENILIKLQLEFKEVK